MLSLINTLPFLIQVTSVAGPPVEVQVRVRTSVNVELSSDVSVIESISRFPGSEKNNVCIVVFSGAYFSTRHSDSSYV